MTHLVGVLEAADPRAHGISEIVVWSSRRTLDQLPSRPWLQLRAETALDGSLPRRLAWQRFALPGKVARSSDLLWVPGGNAFGGFRPFVTMCRNMLPFQPEESRRYGLSAMRLRVELLARSQTRTFRSADGVIFLTDFARRRVLERIGALRGMVTTIPHGVDPRFRLAPRPQRPLASLTDRAPFKLTAISSIDVYKHPWTIAEAVARLRAEGLPVTLDLVGPTYGSAIVRLRATLERVDPEGIGVRYVGKVPFATLQQRYHEADGFVFASSCENMPNILLEAMSAGLPIACSDRGPMPEILGEGGVYFDPERVESAVEAIRTLVRSAELRQRCAAEAFRRSSEYGWDRCANETMKFLASVPTRRGKTA